MSIVLNYLVDVVSEIQDVTKVLRSASSSVVLSRSEIECCVVVAILNQ